MSERYPGGIITKTPVTPTGPYQNGTAPGVWTLDQQLQFQQQGIWPTPGLFQYYIEDVFSTYLYTGNGTSQTITNGIDTSTYGGLVWLKSRSNAQYHGLWDTLRGPTHALNSALSDAEYTTTSTQDLTGFTSSGFSVGTYYNNSSNQNGATYASWTFRKQAKFFDVVTGTCDGSGNITVNHSLGSVPGFVTIKRTDGVSAWFAYHTSLGNNQYVYLNATNAAGTFSGIWNATSTTFTANVGFAAGAQVVLYLWASNAGGFGSAGTDNVITCGSYAGNSSSTGPVITLGYEPQWLLVKDTTASATDWIMQDTMRGMSVIAGDGAYLKANTSGAEATNNYFTPLATGFQPNQASSQVNLSGHTYIYIAIRRGPMKTPTTGTSVYGGFNTTAGATYSVGFVPDLAISPQLLGGGPLTGTRLTWNLHYLQTASAAAEVINGGEWVWNGTTNTFVDQGTTFDWLFKRAPGFCDVVCYTSNYSGNPAVSHNLGVVPELLIFKDRDDSRDWEVYAPSILGSTYTLYLNFDYAKANVGSATTLTSTTFQQQSVQYPTGKNYIAYLFATIAGVSKVGSYTGNGTTQTIDCGFGAGGVRFVLIKRTDSTGNWYVYDTTRGMTTLVDPYILLNSTAAQVATLGSVTTVSTGFALNSSVLAAINVNAGTYIFLAIA